MTVALDVQASADARRPAPAVDYGAQSDERSARRTGMSFQRTRLSADRTLMSVIRTSLSLITFGFTIFQVFQKLKDVAGARSFGLALVAAGMGMLILGIAYHLQFMLGLRRLRGELKADGLLHAESIFPPSFTLLTAVVLLFIGGGAIASMVFEDGPFG